MIRQKIHLTNINMPKILATQLNFSITKHSSFNQIHQNQFSESKDLK